MAGNRHIRTAIGRDYSDVPPTLGTMKGRAETELQVSVRVIPSQALLPPDQEFAPTRNGRCFLKAISRRSRNTISSSSSNSN